MNVNLYTEDEKRRKLNKENEQKIQKKKSAILLDILCRRAIMKKF